MLAEYPRKRKTPTGVLSGGELTSMPWMVFKGGPICDILRDYSSASSPWLAHHCWPRHILPVGGGLVLLRTSVYVAKSSCLLNTSLFPKIIWKKLKWRVGFAPKNAAAEETILTVRSTYAPSCHDQKSPLLSGRRFSVVSGRAHTASRWLLEKTQEELFSWLFVSELLLKCT